MLDVRMIQQAMDLNVEAFPVEPRGAAEGKRINKILRERFGVNQHGEPHFRVVCGTDATDTIGGRTVMRYPYKAKVVDAWRVLLVDENGEPSFDERGERNWIDLDLDPNTWGPEYERYKGKGKGGTVVRYYAMAGVPYWYLEGWLPPAVVADGFYERVFGRSPGRGDYAPLWPLKGDRDEPRIPNESDVAKLAEWIVLQGLDPMLKNQRWEQAQSPEDGSARLDRTYRELAEAEAAEDYEFLNDPERRRDIEHALEATGVIDSRKIYPRIDHNKASGDTTTTR